MSHGLHSSQEASDRSNGPSVEGRDKRPRSRLAEHFDADDFDSDEDLQDMIGKPIPPAEQPAKKRKNAEDDLGEGVMAALSKLRKPD